MLPVRLQLILVRFRRAHPSRRRLGPPGDDLLMRRPGLLPRLGSGFSLGFPGPLAAIGLPGSVSHGVDRHPGDDLPGLRIHRLHGLCRRIRVRGLIPPLRFRSRSAPALRSRSRPGRIRVYDQVPGRDPQGGHHRVVPASGMAAQIDPLPPVPRAFLRRHRQAGRPVRVGRAPRRIFAAAVRTAHVIQHPQNLLQIHPAALLSSCPLKRCMACHGSALMQRRPLTADLLR